MGPFAARKPVSHRRSQLPFRSAVSLHDIVSIQGAPFANVIDVAVMGVLYMYYVPVVSCRSSFVLEL